MSRGISQTDFGMLRSSMSDASVAMMMGRSASWVARVRRKVAAADAKGRGETAAASVPTTAPVRQVVVPAAQTFEPLSGALDGGPSPIKARVLGWCRHYVACGVRIAELADYFDLDADDLGFALNGAVAR